MRYLITISYDGTLFSGYQKQPKERTVQSELEKALKEINGGKKVDVHASGRTDAGVHALNQKVHFDLETKVTTDKLVKGLNSLLPKDIYVKNAIEVKEDFHARFSAIGKEYIYILNMGEYNPIERNYVYQYNKELNIEKMKNEIEYLKGTHDFSAFVNKEEKKESYVRTIYDASITKENNILIFRFIGNGFLKYQVRNMVGALIEVSTKNKSIDYILKSKDRCSFGKTAGAEGLYLNNVEY